MIDKSFSHQLRQFAFCHYRTYLKVVQNGIIKYVSELEQTLLKKKKKKKKVRIIPCNNYLNFCLQILG